jgi:hypothetical protein
MPKYQIESGGQRYEVEAADDKAAARVVEEIGRQAADVGAAKPWRSNEDVNAGAVRSIIDGARRILPGGAVGMAIDAVNSAPSDIPIPKLDPSQRPQGAERYGHTFRNALIPGGNRLAAASKATIDMVRGENGSWGDAYDNALAGEFARSNAIDADKGLADHAAVAGGWLGGAALFRRLPGMQVRPYVGAPRSANAELAAQSADLARTGAGYGMVQSYLDSQKTSPEGRLGDAAAGMFGGAALGPVLPAGMNALAAGASAVRSGLQRMAGVTPDQRSMNRARQDELQSIGITDPSGPVIADGPISGGVARGLAGSVLGQPVARAVERDVLQGQNAVRAPLLQYSGGAPVSDNVQATQQMLRRNLTEHSLSEAELARMGRPELEVMTGPVNESTGFRPPRPVVDPTPPAYPAAVAAERVPMDQVQVDPVRPRQVSAAETMFVPKAPRITDIGLPPTESKARNAAALDVQVRNAELGFAWQRLQAAVDKVYPVGSPLRERSLDPAADFYNRHSLFRAEWDAVAQADAAARQAKVALAAADQAGEKARQAAYVDQIFINERDAFRAARRNQNLQAAEDAAAARETDLLRQKEHARLQREADDAAAAKTTMRATEAENAATADTRRRQIASDQEWERQPGGFAYGRSRETYPTEYGAAEEVVARLTPPFQRNPLGGPGPSGSRTGATATETLLDDMARDLRAANRLPGYRDRGVIDSGMVGGGRRGEISPELQQHLSRFFGDDIAGRLMSYHDSRLRGQLTGRVDGLRNLVSDVRRAAQDAERPPFPGTPRREPAAALRRLEGALNDDLYRFMREAGPEGEVAAGMTRDIRQAYAQHLEGVRQPLSRLFGSREKPVDTMEAANQLAGALRDGDMTIIRSFMQVLREKGREGEAGRAVATMLQHMSGFDGQRGRLTDFLTTMRSLRPEVRRALASTPETAALMGQLGRLERVLPRLAEFEQRLPAQGEDMTRQVARMMANGGNWAHLGLWTLSNLPTALLAAGGTHALARFMGSPRYVSWLTRAEGVRSPSQLQQHIRQLAIIAGNDKEAGEAIMAAIGAAAGTPARAAPPRPSDPRLPADRDYQPGGDDPGMVRQPDPEKPVPNIEMTPDLVRPPMPEPPTRMPRFGRAPDGAYIHGATVSGERSPMADRDAPEIVNPNARTILSALARSMGGKLTDEHRRRAEDLLATDDFLAAIEALDAMPAEQRHRFVPGLLQRLQGGLGN